MTDQEEPLRWPFEGGALLVDDEAVVRRACASQLAAAGCDCQVAETYSDALELFQRDPQISVVILDHGVAGDNTMAFVRQLKTIRPGVILVGSSGRDFCHDFTTAGVPRFLLKPWTADDLIRTVHKIAECVSCGLPIPLQRPLPGQKGSHWVCRGCGSRYHATLDEDAPPEHRDHVEYLDA